MNHLSLVMPFYDNAGMLARQYAIWAAYPDRLKQRIDVVLVDDGSPVPALDVPRPPGLPDISIYRVLEDRPWHQHAARNLGAHVAIGPWLFLTDMDHVLPAPTLARLLRLRDPVVRTYYTFQRVDADTRRLTLDRHGLPKPHPNTFAMTRELFWRVGGYDEEYCGVYGTDGLFRTRLAQHATRRQFRHPVIRYSRDVVPDASTRTLARKEGREEGAKRKITDRKLAEGRADMITTLAFPWERVL